MSGQAKSLKPTKFSLLDIIIVIVIIAAAAGAAAYLNSGGTGDIVEITYTVEFTGLKPAFEGMPQPGDNVYDSIKGYYMGQITDVRYAETIAYLWSSDEKQYNAISVPNEITCFITIKTNGSETDSQIKTSGDDIELRVGKLVYVKGKGYASGGYVVSVSTQKKEA